MLSARLQRTPRVPAGRPGVLRARCFFILLSIFFLLPSTWHPIARAQGYEQPLNARWREWAGFRNLQGLVPGAEGEGYAWSRQGIVRYREAVGELERIGRVQGLSRSMISAVAFSRAHGCLVVAYADGVVDLLETQPGIRRTVCQESLSENVLLGRESPMIAMATHGDFAYCLTPERVYIMELPSGRIVGSVRVWVKDPPGAEQLTAIVVVGGKLYVGSRRGLWVSALPLSPLEGWFTRVAGPEGEVRVLTHDAGQSVGYCAVESAGEHSVWRIEAGGVALVGKGIGGVTGCAAGADGLYLGVERALWFFSRAGSGPRRVYAGPGDGLPFRLRGGYVASSGALLMAVGGQGLLRASRDASGALPGGFSQILSEGPLSEEVRAMVRYGDGVALCHGDGDEFPLSVYISCDPSTGQERLDLFPSHRGGQCLAVLDAQRGHYLVGTQQQGLLEVEAGRIVKQYQEGNSPLEPMAGGISVSGILRDREGGWWLYNPGNPKPLLHRDPSGGWAAFPCALSSFNAEQQAIMRQDDAGRIWVALAGQAGLLALDPDTFVRTGGDAGYAFTQVHNRQRFSPSAVRDFDFLPNGELAVSTSEGIALSQNSDRFLAGETLRFSAPVFANPLNQNVEAHILNTQPLLSMVVVPGGRLWVGTEHNGLYQVDVEEKAAVRHIAYPDSPLPSRELSHLVFLPELGVLYVGTPNGLVSLSIDALRASEDFREAKVYPNPVHPGYSDNVTVDGLLERTTVKITDIAGRLVRELQSQGGRVLWDQRNGVGERVGSGIYLLFCTNPDARLHRILKLAIVR